MHSPKLILKGQNLRKLFQNEIVRANEHQTFYSQYSHSQQTEREQKI